MKRPPAFQLLHVLPPFRQQPHHPAKGQPALEGHVASIRVILLPDLGVQNLDRSLEMKGSGSPDHLVQGQEVQDVPGGSQHQMGGEGLLCQMGESKAR